MKIDTEGFRRLSHIMGAGRARSLFLLVSCLLGLCASGCHRTSALSKYRATAPLILISVDTLRADHLPSYGYAQVETPALDRFFKDAILFENCYSHCPQTLPSHTSILTGLLPCDHAVRDNNGFALSPHQSTIATVLKSEGFATGGFVSAYVLRSETRIGLGFDRYDAKMEGNRFDVGMGEIQRSGKATIAAARDWLGHVRQVDPSRRFFLFLHLYEPHTPYEPPEPFRTRYSVQPYDGEIAYTDSLIGSFLDELRQDGLYDRSLIIFTSDHGEGLGDHGELEHGVLLYREDIHVPLAIKYPGGLFAGERVSWPVQHIDLLPTVLDFYGLPTKSSLQGSSLLGLREAGMARAIYSETLYPLYHFGWSDLYSLSDDSFQYIRAPREELYDLRADRNERSNLAPAQAAAATRYRRLIEQKMAGKKAEAPATVSPEELEKLQALGYVGSASAPFPSKGLRPDPKDRIQLVEEFQRGIRFHREGNERQAAVVFAKIVEQNPDMVDVLDQLARSLIRLNRIDEGLGLLRRVAIKKKENAVQLQSIAAEFWKARRLDDALKYTEQSLSVDPKLATAYQLKGEILSAKEDRAGALAALDRALSIDPVLPLPYYLKGLLMLQADQPKTALSLFRQAAKAAEEGDVPVLLPSLHSYMGAVLAQQGDFSAAADEFRKELDIFPDTTGARIGLAQVLMQLGRRDEALKLFDRPPLPDSSALTALCGFLRSIGEVQRARALEVGRTAQGGSPESSAK